MATKFSQLYKQELKSRGVLSSLGSAALKQTRQRMDIRNTLFGGSGVLSLAGQKIFGKGYSPLDKASNVLSSSPTNTSSAADSQGITDLLASSERQESLLRVISKNTFNMNMMARDTNITRQNIVSLTKKMTGKSSRTQDALWYNVKTRNTAIDSLAKKRNETAQPGNTTPSNAGGSSSFMGSIMGGLGTLGSLGGGILGGLFGVISKMSPILAIIGLAGAAYVVKQLVSQVDFTGLKKSMLEAIGIDSTSEEPIMKQLAKKLDAALGLDSKPFGSFYEWMEKSPFMNKLGDKISSIAKTASDYTTAAFRTLADGFGRIGEIFSYYFGEFFNANKGLILGVLGASIGSLLGVKGAALGGLIGAVVGHATGNKDLPGLMSEQAEKQQTLNRLTTERDELEKNEANLNVSDRAKLNSFRTGDRAKAVKQLEDSISQLQIEIEKKSVEQKRLLNFDTSSIFNKNLEKVREDRAEEESKNNSPVKVSSPYGMRTHPISGRLSLHEGVDVPMREGSNIYAAESGKVKRSGSASGYGNMIEIDHGNGKTTRYAHLKSMNVAVGDMVEKGQKIALSGNTGDSTGPHLHFEERENGQATRPSPQLLATAVRGQMLNENSVNLANASRPDTSPPNVTVVNQQTAAAPQQSKPQNAAASAHNFDPWTEIWSASILNPARMGS
jgi:murein DD-endopeptidase MepM/ murein hydrolase activator NlpD